MSCALRGELKGWTVLNKPKLSKKLTGQNGPQPLFTYWNQTVRSNSGNFRVTVNHSLEADKHLLPKSERTFSTLNGAHFLSKLYLQQAYLHLGIEEEHHHHLIISMNKVPYKFKHLSYRIATTPAIWQFTMEKAPQAIDSYVCSLATFVWWEPPRISIWNYSWSVEKPTKLHVNKDKCSFMKDEILYYGYVTDADGIHKPQGKVKAILDIPGPTTVKRLQSFMGQVLWTTMEDSFWTLPRLPILGHSFRRKNRSLYGHQTAKQHSTKSRPRVHRIRSWYFTMARCC